MSRLSAFALLLLAPLLAVFPTAARAQDPPGPPLQLMKLNDNAKGLCMQTAAHPPSVGSRLMPTVCMDMGGLQMFSFWPMSGGGYRIQNTATGGCLQFDQNLVRPGEAVLDISCNYQNNQRWDVQYFSGYTKIRTWPSGLCVGVANARVSLVNCNGWGIDSRDTGPAWDAVRQRNRTSLDGIWGLKNVQSGFCMTTDIYPVLGSCRGTTRNDLSIVPVGFGNSAALEFEFRRDRGSHLCLIETKHNMAYYSSCPDSDGVWRLLQVLPPADQYSPITANRWQVQNVKSGRCLADSHSILATAPCNGTAATTWYALPTPP